MIATVKFASVLPNLADVLADLRGRGVCSLGGVPVGELGLVLGWSSGIRRMQLGADSAEVHRVRNHLVVVGNVETNNVDGFPEVERVVRL